MSRRWAVVAAACIAAAGVAFFATRDAGASPGSMSCSTPPGGVYTCTWGFNYEGPSLNEIVTGPSNYFVWLVVTVSSGGTTYQGFGPSGCHHTSVGNSAWGGTPSDLGCGGYINPFSQYHTGAQSYLQFQSHV
jgi:hypothetical protein